MWRGKEGLSLLTPARARLEDAGLVHEERGLRSVGLLSRLLKLDSNAIDVATHEFRRQMAAAGVEGAAGAI